MNNIETETIDKLFLELSQVSKARTKRELRLQMFLSRIIGVNRDFDPDSPEFLGQWEQIVARAIELKDERLQS